MKVDLDLQGDLDSVINPRVLKVLIAAEENGWTENPYHSFAVRFQKPDDPKAKPFFMRWDLFKDPETGKRSWRFAGARAQNGQALNYRDAVIYLQDTSVIYPEPPEEGEPDGS